MSTRKFLTIAAVAFMGLLPMACDAPSDDTDTTQETVATSAQEPQAGGEAPVSISPTQDAGQDLPPSITPPADAQSVTDDVPSMDEGSPGAEAVTEDEIPHSDVPPPSRAVFTDKACDFEAWVGKAVDEVAIKETGRPFRILKPDSMMTMDHNPDRINVVTDKEEGIVARVWCG
ncbi:MAG: hypothetical protein DI551_04245 [Micavibrio aeruginosavorus]|uniref:Peptidase inhibitor I78 family protein n=1 Tax=Micavibrio aeruginosavorus TaxID=349221 RepID=A0A2W5N0J9_9BACT|nr:MAG: hypothetical protein DI551_04245 [Micavibrio aeruginosavorus]